MKKQIVRYLGLHLLIFAAINCAVITVNVYFPTEAIEEAAEKIINEIEGEEESQVIPDESSSQSHFWSNVPFYVLGNSTVYAQEIDLNLTTPAIRKVIATMKTRNSKVMHFKDKGLIGETYDGMLAIRDMSDLSGEDIRTIKRLLRAENNDRKTLYKELAVANKISLSEISRIKTVFAKTRRTKGKPGHWFQDEKGKWTQK
ncbi:MAG: YdbL family protein [Candidatus Scalindua sediminis]|nr:YdbL family protein [Candidatus Scalindua sediminis]